MFGLGLGRLGASGSGAFSPSTVAGKRLWLRPSVTAGMWQDPAGTTSMSAVGTLLDTSNPVGLMLDYSQGAALGPELVASLSAFNGTISGPTAPILATCTTNGIYGVQSSLAVANKTCKVVISWSGNTALRQIYLDLANSYANSLGTTESGSKTLYLRPSVNNTTFVYAVGGLVGESFILDNISVREVTGIHLTQSTSTARPVLSARQNLFVSTEDLTNGAWLANEVTPTATTITTSVASGQPSIRQTATVVSGVAYTYFLTFRAGTKSSARVGINLSGWGLDADTNGEIVSGPGSIARSVGSLHDITGLSSSVDTVVAVHRTMTSGGSAACYVYVGVGSGVIGDSIGVTKAQLNIGSTATPYQRVNTASDYTTVIPQYVKYDGTDDALASATITAGTLGSNVDVFMVVRRDSAGNVTLGYPTPGSTTFFGMAESGSASVCHASVGTPTVWVDGVQLAGGTSVTRGTLHTALTVGDWHVVEFRNLDLSAWTQIGQGGHTGYLLNGAMGERLIADAMPDATRAKVRTYLGKTVGKVL